MTRKEFLEREIAYRKELIVRQTDLTKGVLDQALYEIRKEIKRLQDELDEIIIKEREDERNK